MLCSYYCNIISLNDDCVIAQPWVLSIFNYFCYSGQGDSTNTSQRGFILFRQHHVTEVEELLCVWESSTLCYPCSVSVGGGSAGCWRSTCPTVSLPGGQQRVSVRPRTKHTSLWSDHQLCLFSPAALRDRCKCSTNPDTLSETSPAALHLFIRPSSSSPSLSSPPGRASLFLPAFLQRCE